MKKETWLAQEIRFLGMTQKEFAKALNTGESSVTGWIKGKSIIGPLNFRKMLELGISKEALKNPMKKV